MIKFITKRTDHKVTLPTLDNTEELEFFLSKQIQVGYDKEFNGLDAYTCIPLLTSIGNSDRQYVIDDTSIDISFLNKYNKILFIGHNIKIDYKLSVLQGVQFRNIWDTMIVEQRLGMGSGRANTLDATLQRRTNTFLSKSTRDDFMKMNKKSIFLDEHIKYAAEDVGYLEDLIEVQKKYIEKFNMDFLLTDVEFPLTSILGDSELVGCALNENNWREIIKDNKEKKFKLESELDAEIKKLLLEKKALFPDFKIPKKYINPRKKETLVFFNLFEPPSVKENLNLKNVNWSSSKQIIDTFKLLGEKVPEINIKDTKTKKKKIKQSIGEDSLVQYKIKNPDSILKLFIDILLKYKETEKELTTYGERFLTDWIKKKTGREKGYKNSVTGKVHTYYGQCFTDTGRLSSGDAKQGYFNSQNLPASEKYRNSFIADPGKLITKCDLSGAELMLGASLSGDERLIKLVLSGDPHSPLANSSYNSIIKYIVNTMKEDRAIIELEELLKANRSFLKDKDKKSLTQEAADLLTIERAKKAYEDKRFIITKESANDLRESFKAVVYGLCYGASADRIAEVLSISKYYAQLIEETMKNELPILFKYLQDNSNKGVRDGYVIFNKRTNSRRWFPQVLIANELGVNVSFKEKGDIERQCKNSPIQGTQSDGLKEAIVRYFYEYVYPNNLDIQLIFNVHDEIVIQHPEEDIESPKILSKYMNETLTHYLVEGLQMQSEYKTNKYWEK